MAKQEWLLPSGAVRLVQRVVGPGISRGVACVILCDLGNEVPRTVGIRGAQGIREWEEIDPDDEVVRDGFGAHWHFDVRFYRPDLENWLARNREGLKREYGIASRAEPERAPSGVSSPTSTPRRTLQEAAGDYIAKQHPDGVPPGITNKMLAEAYRGEKRTPMSERTMRRARKPPNEAKP